jgi:hypothetical protein
VLGRVLLSSLFVTAVAACHTASPPRTPEETCRAACESRVRACDDDGCERGCNFVLDRLIENQLEPIMACMGKMNSCEDGRWAYCGARIGEHADGGPPAPPPPPEDG